MEEAILNSLLRYSKQVTPSRETYPIPSTGWKGSLRRVEAPINLSNYYLFDRPGLGSVSSLSKSPSKRRCRVTTSGSSLALSPSKKSTKASPKKASCIGSTEPSRKITEPDSEIKNIVEREKKERAKIARHFKSYDSLEHLVSEPEDTAREQSFHDSQSQVVASLRGEIERLKQELEATRSNISHLESVSK